MNSRPAVEQLTRCWASIDDLVDQQHRQSVLLGAGDGGAHFRTGLDTKLLGQSLLIGAKRETCRNHGCFALLNDLK